MCLVKVTFAPSRKSLHQYKILTEIRCGATIDRAIDYFSGRMNGLKTVAYTTNSTIHALFPFILRPYSVILSQILTKSKKDATVNILTNQQYLIYNVADCKK